MAILQAQSDAARAYLPLITTKGEIRRSAPKDGNAKYVWRMVAFAVSTDPRQQCMPMTADFGVEPPADWHVAPPSAWLDAERTRVLHPHYFTDANRPADIEQFLRASWTRYNGAARRRHYIKTVLDPIVEEIIASVPPRRQAGTMRWARAFGVV